MPVSVFRARRVLPSIRKSLFLEAMGYECEVEFRGRLYKMLPDSEWIANR